jgi:hypothetical protein
MSYRPDRASTDSTVDPLAAAPIPRPATAGNASPEPAGASLTLTGNKTIAIEFGSSRTPSCARSLDLSVSGTLAPGVEPTGALSDRNTPLTAAGSTRDLQSLDRLLIELKAPQGGAAGRRGTAPRSGRVRPARAASARRARNGTAPSSRERPSAARASGAISRAVRTAHTRAGRISISHSA